MMELTPFHNTTICQIKIKYKKNYLHNNMKLDFILIQWVRVK
jgi:hypothetical protein